GAYSARNRGRRTSRPPRSDWPGSTGFLPTPSPAGQAHAKPIPPPPLRSHRKWQAQRPPTPPTAPSSADRRNALDREDVLRRTLIGQRIRERLPGLGLAEVEHDGLAEVAV